MEKLLLDIVHLPPLNLRVKLGKQVKEAVGNAKVKYLVDNEGLIPHQSLFHIATTGDNLPQIYIRLEKILSDIKPFSISAEGLVDNDNVIAVKLSEPPELRQLHEEVVGALFDLRVGEMPWTPGRQPSTLEKEYREKYGTQHILKNFSPHISLVKLANPVDAEKVLYKIGKIDFDYSVNDFAVAKVNFWHQVTNIIKEFRLKKEIK